MRLLLPILVIFCIAACSDPFETPADADPWRLVEGDDDDPGAEPLDCPDENDPGVTYVGGDPQACEGIFFGETQRHWCELSQESFHNECGCGCIGEPELRCTTGSCPDGQYCHFDDRSCGEIDLQGTCRPHPQDCTDDVEEVCGCDGEFYRGSSSCAARQSGVDHHWDTSFCGAQCDGIINDEANQGVCYILGECFVDGEANPFDECQYCDPWRTPYTWTDIPGCAPQVEAGRFHSCAVDRDNRMHCWPDDNQPGGRAQAPDGYFSLATTGHYHSCGLGQGEAIRCWGSDHEALTNAPIGQFSHISASRWYSCGVDASMELQCWGRSILSHGQSEPPEGRFLQVSTAPDFACAVRDDRQIQCWGQTGSQTNPPAGDEFVHVSVDITNACALDMEGTIHCWGQNGHGQSDPPQGQFRQLSVGRFHGCAIDLEGRLQCWGRDQFGQASPPPGRFRQVSAGSTHSCAFDLDDQIHCWGEEERVDAPF